MSKKKIFLTITALSILFIFFRVLNYNKDIIDFKREMAEHGYNLKFDKSQLTYLLTPNYLDEMNNGNKFLLYPYPSQLEAQKDFSKLKEDISSNRFDLLSTPGQNQIFFIKNSIIILYIMDDEDPIYIALKKVLGNPEIFIEDKSLVERQ